MSNPNTKTIAMKYIHKIFIAISISSLLLFAATPAEAQFLKKLGNALEKVNEKLEEANEFLNDPTAKQKKQRIFFFLRKRLALSAPSGSRISPISAATDMTLTRVTTTGLCRIEISNSMIW